MSKVFINMNQHQCYQSTRTVKDSLVKIMPARFSVILLLFMANSGCPLQTLLRQEHKGGLPKTAAILDDAAADILEKKVPPYRPPGSSGSSNLPSITHGMLEETGINVLVDPIKISSENSGINFNRNFKIPSHGPYFDVRRTKNVTALKGVTSNLVCRVRRLGNETVSWIRHSDTSLLTVGRYTYTTDLRFEAFHSPHTEDWILQLRNPKSSDSGVYECQISTTPHLTHKIFLTVHEPSTYVIGGPDMFVDIGSMVNLSCVVSYTEKPPDKVVWLHNEEEISFRGPRSGVSVITEKASNTTIHLLMQGARAGDSGIYKCKPNNAPEAQIKVHILIGGNQPAGLQTNAGSAVEPNAHYHEIIIYLLISTIAFANSLF